MRAAAQVEGLIDGSVSVYRYDCIQCRPKGRNNMKGLAAAAIASAILMAPVARAAEVTLIAPGGIRAAVVQMVPDFEKKSGHKVKGTFGSGGGTKERVIKGEAFDVPIVQLPLEPV